MISTPLQFNQIELHKKNKFVVTKKKKTPKHFLFHLYVRDM